jgi:hypothetical protein
MTEQITIDHLGRLRAMIAPGQQTWDLSPNDVEAIAMAVRVLDVIAFLDKPHCRMDLIDSNKVGKVLALETRSDDSCTIVSGRQFRGETWLECFSEAGRSIG